MKKVITFLLLCLASTAMLAQQVSVNYKHNANFSQHHTYVWGSNNRSAVQNSILAQVAALPANRDNSPAVYAGPLVGEPSA